MSEESEIAYISVRETARRLQVHENTVRNWAKEGKLQPANIPGSRGLRFEARDVERLIQRRGEVVDSIERERRTIGPELVDATQLHAWAELRRAQDTFPGLIRRLLLSTAGLTNVSVRAGEGVSLSGWDGRAESAGVGVLPDGRLIIEIGVGKQSKTKADSDYETRKRELGSDAKDFVFVFVTARRWKNGAIWASERRKEQAFAGVEVIDADDLEAWLELTPDVHHWISEELGRRPQHAQTLSRWWERFRSQTDPPLPAGLFLAGRQTEADQLTSVLRAAPTVVTVQAGWRNDALAFVQQVVMDVNEAGDFDEPLTIASAEVWDRVIERRGHMTLIPLFDGPDVATALAHGHHVVLVAGSDEYVRGAKIDLPRPHRQEGAEALRAAGVEYETAYRLSGLARRSVPALVRELSRDSRVSRPAWAQLPSASTFAPAMLVGAWTSSEADHSVVERVTGQEWSKVERVLNHWHATGDAPFVKSGQQNWNLASPEEAFLVLHSQLTTRDLETWRAVAVDVLLEVDPRLDLAADQRPMAGLLEVRRRFSGVLRQGVAQSLALLGGLDHQVVAHAGPASDHAAWVVREVLRKAAEDESGRTWQSLSDVLPLVAEASPRACLEAIHLDLDRESPLLASMFQDRVDDPWFSTSSPHTGLLWALEGLCWSSEWLLEAAHALARLDHIDPGGRLGNRPLESLSSIFPHWIRHTGASLETRIDALRLICRQVPDTGWNLMRKIWPSHHATSSPPHAPRFRDWKPASVSVLITEAIEYIGEVVSLALELAGDDPERWAELAEHLAPLPPGDRERVLTFLEQKADVELDDAQQLALWHRLHTEIARHRRFSHADWSMDKEALKRLEAIAVPLEPTGQVARHAYLFDWRPDLPGFDDDHAAYDNELKRLREAAVRETLADPSLTGLRDLAHRSRAPRHLGVVLADEAADSLSPNLLQWLDSDDPKLREVASAWAAKRSYIRGVEWIMEMLATPEASVAERRLGLVLAAEPTHQLWAAIRDADPSLLDDYWTTMNPWRVVSGDVDHAARKLMAHDRPWAAVDMLASDLHGQRDGNGSLDSELVLEVLKAATQSDPGTSGSQALGYEVGLLLDYLETTGVDRAQIASLEFVFFRLIDDHRVPRALFAELGADSSAFVELVKRVYRGKSEPRREQSENEAALSEQAWWVLHGWDRLPGLGEDGEIDATHLTKWVREARLAFSESDRADIGDEEIGRVLAMSPPGSDGIWPAEPVRDLIEMIGNSFIEGGFVTGRYNSRGVTTRGVFDGGNLERAEAGRYLDWSKRSARDWPRTSRILRGLAESYIRDAARQDAEAEITGDSD